MSEYGESFEEFVDEESIGDADDNTMRRSRSRSPSRPLKPLAVPAIHESSYEDESFEAATSTSPSKAATTTHIATHLQPVDALVKFPLGSVVEVYWPDEKEWFTGAVRHYDTTHGYFVQYADGDEQWEDESAMRWPPQNESLNDHLPQAPPDSSTILPPPALNYRILVPRAYTALAHHPSTIKVARPYTSVATHPTVSSMYVTPRKFTSAMEACIECKARCGWAHETIKWGNIGSTSTLSTGTSIYGQHPSDHRFLQPNVMEQETQTHACSRGSQ
ncbi:hypothetical protein H257_16334 [Aphanomyces astaci]|uniref:Tudor domain-containing protein n=1 Tax=Aphanomyces astaci TaxID=112090 RepID=W4FL74_APHAT|nr:hypothetical protein H257_16334 [Aphanomyces astaci]ETV67463.1 hypothetical protein H257_16334 [Aphanomyces astaci]|eukprot:XP_009843022.1 hypothetical protein H257_16334 [Aphanomyces astaci]